MLYYPLWKKLLIGLVVGSGILFAAPNFLDEEKRALPVLERMKTVNLGLDLRGGVHLLLEVKADQVVREQLERLSEDARQTLRKQKIVAARPKIERNKLLVVQIANPRQADGFANEMLANNPDISVNYIRGGEVGIALKETILRNLQIDAVDRSIEIIRRRIDETGTREPLIQRQGSSRIVVQVPGLDDPESLKSLIGRTAKLTFHLVNEQIPAESLEVPVGYVRMPSQERDANGKPVENYIVTSRALVSGENLRSASTGFDQNNQPAVEFGFDSAGAFKFGNITGNNVGRRLAIVLDNEIISAPVIQSAIIGGNGIITGSFSVDEANNLAILLRAGALPAALDIVEERSVGPGLGSDSVEAGKLAFVIALIAVGIFMMMAYGRFGFVSNIALLINLTLIFAVLSVLQATLTLPGIAGIILTIGMAVDANVLIFERIREEYRQGRAPIDAIDSGFRNAFATIVDANITTLIAAFLLFILGTGPIKGFAVTLSIGIFTSMFSAIVLSRYLMANWVHRNREREDLPLA